MGIRNLILKIVPDRMAASMEAPTITAPVESTTTICSEAVF